MRLFNIKIILPIFVLGIFASVLAINFKSDSVSYAIATYEKPKTPIITSLSSSTLEDDALSLTINPNNDGNNYFVNVLNVTLNRKDNYIPKYPLTYQKLTRGKEYNVIARVCKKYDKEYVCSDWTPVSKGVAQEKRVASSIGSVTLDNTEFTYDGNIKNPNVIVKNANGIVLTKNTDYSLELNQNSKEIGIYKVTVKGINNYTGEISNNYKIVPPSVFVESVVLGTNTIKVNIKDNSRIAHGSYYEVGLYQNDLEKPIQSLKTMNKSVEFKNLNSNTNYRIRVRTSKTVNNENITSSWSTPVGVTTKTGTKIPISGSTVSLSTSSYTYNGSAKKPSVTVKKGVTTLVNQKNYSVSYKNNTNIGKATAVITGIGNYTGTINKTFKINPGKVTYNGNITSNNNSITVKIKSLKGGVKYQYGYKKSSGSYKYITTTSTSKKITNLSKNTSYKVKVRACKKVSGTNYCGSYSTEKTIKTTGSSTKTNKVSGSSSTSSTTANKNSSGTKKTSNVNKKCGKNQIYSGGSCKCVPGYTKKGSSCVHVQTCPKGAVRNKNGKCVCGSYYRTISKSPLKCESLTYKKQGTTKKKTTTKKTTTKNQRNKCLMKCNGSKSCAKNIFGFYKSKTKCNQCKSKC